MIKKIIDFFKNTTKEQVEKWARKTFFTSLSAIGIALCIVAISGIAKLVYVAFTHSITGGITLLVIIITVVSGITWKAAEDLIKNGD